MKKDMTRFSFVLGVIAVVTARGVAGVFEMTRSRIGQKERIAFENALETIFPNAARFVPAAAGEGAEMAATVTSRAVTEAAKSAVGEIETASAGEAVTDGRR